MTTYFDQKPEGIATGDGFVGSDAFSTRGVRKARSADM
jgi:hypothetical protein